MLRTLRKITQEAYEKLGLKYEIGYRTLEGWKAPLMFYRFKCPKHGWVESRIFGYNRRLECPLCLQENRVGYLKQPGVLA